MRYGFFVFVSSFHSSLHYSKNIVFGERKGDGWNIAFSCEKRDSLGSILSMHISNNFLWHGFPFIRRYSAIQWIHTQIFLHLESSILEPFSLASLKWMYFDLKPHPGKRLTICLLFLVLFLSLLAIIDPIEDIFHRSTTIVVWKTIRFIWKHTFIRLYIHIG